MNILITLSYEFNYDLRSLYQARSLIKAGHDVTVFTWSKDKKNILHEKREGFNIVRFRNTKFMDMLPYNTSKLCFWRHNAYKEALELDKIKSIDAVHCHNLDTLPIGIKLKKKLGCKLVYDAREIWGYMLRRDLPESWANYYLWKEKHLLKYVDEMITVNEPLKEYFSKMTDKPITIIMNCKPLQGKKYESPNNNKFTLLYLGVLGKPRFLLELVDVVKELPDVYCIIGGSGSKQNYVDALKDKCSKAQNVDFIGRIPMEEVLPMTKKADAVVCMINPKDPNNSRALANKQFEAMVCGRPIITTKGTYVGKVTQQEKCGLVIDYSKHALKHAIIKMRDNPKLCKDLGEHALQAGIKKYNWEKQDEKLLGVYKDQGLR